MNANRSLVSQIDSMTKRIEIGIEECRTSDDKYKQYLSMQSKFHRYSVNNCILIAQQMPDASYVAGYTTWRGFSSPDNPVHVKKGEAGIQIMAPAPYKKDVDVKDEAGNPKLDEFGRRVVETIVVPAYKPCFVFDISQVEGISIDDISPCTLLTGSVENYGLIKQALESISPVPVEYDEITSGANGFFSLTEQKICVRNDISEEQSIKTLCHEIAHSELHNDVSHELALEQSVKETQAESVAFILCEHLGIDSSQYTFPYLASWCDKDISEFKQSLDVIQKASKDLITRLDAELLSMQMMQTHELAYYIRDFGYLYIHETDGGYDYSLFDLKYRLKDGGDILTDQRIDEAASELVKDMQQPSYKVRPIDTNILLSKIAYRGEAAQNLALNIAAEIYKTDDNFDKENEIVNRVYHEIEAGRGAFLTQLEGAALVNERAKELLSQVEELTDIKEIVDTRIVSHVAS